MSRLRSHKETSMQPPDSRQPACPSVVLPQPSTLSLLCGFLLRCKLLEGGVTSYLPVYLQRTHVAGTQEVAMGTCSTVLSRSGPAQSPPFPPGAPSAQSLVPPGWQLTNPGHLVTAPALGSSLGFNSCIVTFHKSPPQLEDTFLQDGSQGPGFTSLLSF